MTGDDERHIDEYLARLKQDGKSAPAGRHWDQLYRLITKDFPKSAHPALPLILAGSIACNADKQQRLREHLVWASAQGRLPEAFEFLDRIPEGGWNVGPLDSWTRSFSWEDSE